MPIDANRVAPKLWIGSFPPPGNILCKSGVDTLVLCAMELQPDSSAYPGIRVIHAPLDDFRMDDRTNRIANNVAKQVAHEVLNRRRVLVTCAQGRNRSGLVVALALRNLTGASGRRCREAVQMARENALTNSSFAAYLDSLPARVDYR